MVLVIGGNGGPGQKFVLKIRIKFGRCTCGERMERKGPIDSSALKYCLHDVMVRSMNPE